MIAFSSYICSTEKSMFENCCKSRFFYCILWPRQSIFSFIVPAVILQPELIWLKSCIKIQALLIFISDLNFEEKIIIFVPKRSYAGCANRREADDHVPVYVCKRTHVLQKLHTWVFSSCLFPCGFLDLHFQRMQWTELVNKIQTIRYVGSLIGKIKSYNLAGVT